MGDCYSGHEISLGVINNHLLLESCGGGIESSAVVNDGIWHHVVAVWDSNLNTGTLYVDGSSAWVLIQILSL